jgi:hypothetical protein
MAGVKGRTSNHTRKLHEQRLDGKKALPSLKEAIKESPELREEVRARLAAASRNAHKREERHLAEIEEIAIVTNAPPPEKQLFINRAQALAILKLSLDLGENLVFAIKDQDNYDALIVEVSRIGGDPFSRFKLGASGGYARLADPAGPLEAPPSHADRVQEP